MERYSINIPLPVNGVNLTDDSLIGDREAAEGTKNMSFKDGIPQTRKGYVRLNEYSFVNNPNTLFNYMKDGIRYLLAASGNTLYKQNGDTFSSITGTLNSDKISCLNFPFKFADPDTYSDKCLILDGAKLRYYDGGDSLKDIVPFVTNTDYETTYGTNVLTTTPDEINKQKFILNDNERIWVAGYGKIVRISYLQKPDYFPSNQVWKLDEDCTGMAHFMDEVILFTENTAVLISGSTPNWSLPDKYVYTKLPGGYGCSNHRSIAVGDNAIYWANKSGIYRYRYLPSGYSIPECVSEFLDSTGSRRSIKKWITGIDDWTKVYAEFYDHEYRLYIGNKKVIVFDTIGSTWTIYEYDKEFNCSTVYNNTLYYAADRIYHMDYTYDPYGVGLNGLSDDGNAIEFRLKSKFYDFDKAANKKRFKKLILTLYSELISYNIDVILNMDNDYVTIKNEVINSISRWGMFLFGSKIASKKTNLNYPIKIHHRGKKYNMAYELVCTGINQAFVIKDIGLILKVKELK
jgi:hypothetical protein